MQDVLPRESWLSNTTDMYVVRRQHIEIRYTAILDEEALGGERLTSASELQLVWGGGSGNDVCL